MAEEQENQGSGENAEISLDEKIIAYAKDKKVLVIDFMNNRIYER